MKAIPISYSQFIKNRNEALLSLDKEKIQAYAKKYGARFSDNDEIFWASVHKARIAVKEIPEKEKEVSRKWLTEHGFKCEIGA